MSRLEAATAEELTRAWRLAQTLREVQRAADAAIAQQAVRQRMPIAQLDLALESARHALALYSAASHAADRLRAELDAHDAVERAWQARSGPFTGTPGRRHA